MKSCATVSAKVKAWLGAPVVSCVLILKLYEPAVALLGTLMVAVRLAVPPVETVTGFAGDSVQVAPESALASQVELIFPP